MNIQNYLKQKIGGKGLKPVFFRLSDKKEVAILEKLFEKGEVREVSDDYEGQVAELYAINHPEEVNDSDFKKKIEKNFAKLKKEKPAYEQGFWVYYPWLSKIVHILEKEDF